MRWLRILTILTLVAHEAILHAEPTVDLALHRTQGRSLSLAVYHRERPSRGMFVGPSYVPASDAESMRHVMPRPVLRVLAAPVGPWGAAFQTIGTSFGAGVGIYARF
jgi:hypothetical protein